MGKKPHFVNTLRLPVRDYISIKNGSGVRKGVSTFMGDLLEQYRLKEKGEGSLLLRQQNVNDEWAHQIGKGIETGILQHALRHTATHCNTLQHTAAGILKHTAVHK